MKMDLCCSLLGIFLALNDVYSAFVASSDKSEREKREVNLVSFCNMKQEKLYI